MGETDFAGKNGFIWWVGIVEARDDPLTLGRLRVRIIGWHTDNKSELPTDKLPWSEILLPANGTGMVVPIKEGEWVMGFFKDGTEGQQPVVLGVFPGIISSTRREVTSSTDVVDALNAELETQRAKLDELVKRRNEVVANDPQGQNPDAQNLQNQINDQRKLVESLQERANQYKSLNEASPQAGFTDPRSQAQVNKGPREPQYSKDGVVGEPSLPRIVRGVVNGTVHAQTNARREHVCDISNELKGISDWAKALLKFLSDVIRFLVNAVTGSMNIDATGKIRAIAEKIRKFNRILRDIRDYLKIINAALAVVTRIVRYIRAMIDFILGLPAKLLAFLRKCLAEFLGALARIFSDMFSSATSGSGLGELVSAVQETISVTSEIITESIKIITFPAQLTAAFLTPTSEAEQKEALAYFKGMITTNTDAANASSAAAPVPVTSANAKKVSP